MVFLPYTLAARDIGVEITEVEGMRLHELDTRVGGDDAIKGEVTGAVLGWSEEDLLARFKVHRGEPLGTTNDEKAGHRDKEEEGQSRRADFCPLAR